MSLNQESSDEMRAIASLAMAHSDELKSTHEKLLVLRGLTKILATAEAQFADNIAFMLAKAEENQLQFIALLSAPRSTPPPQKAPRRTPSDARPANRRTKRDSDHE